MSGMSELEPNLDRSISLFTNELSRLTKGTSAVVDMSPWLQFWAFDALGEVNFSQAMGFLKAGKDIDGICELDHQMMFYFAKWGQILSLEKLVARFMKWSRTLKPNPLYNFVLDLVHERLKHPSNSTDMLNRLLALHKKDPEKVSLREVIGAAYINVYATRNSVNFIEINAHSVTAHDVVAIELRAILYHVSRNPRCYEKMMKEIMEAEEAQMLSYPAKYSEVSMLPYVSATIQEALRIHPSTGTMFERYVPEGGVILHGKYIPEGTTIGCNAWVVNRNKEVFGEDVETFRPERWIENTPDRLQIMRKTLLTVGTISTL
ncbi:MAG: hypothetical protein M1821_000585 [Bathelium mastoideum]|nr:MAG: hypothetical protein M1821_000585 [Bathelium mastoideum]